jgi:hypothetical protein
MNWRNLPLNWRNMLIASALVLVVLCLFAWWSGSKAAWATYLAVWWFCIGCVLGGLVNVWIHNLTGGAWGEEVREPLIALARVLPVLAIFFVPVLLAHATLYPWAVGTADGDHRWAGEVAHPEFRRAFLSPTFFVLRSIAYLAIWTVLAFFTRRHASSRSRPFSAAALMIYSITVTFAGVDWIMSLVPEWQSTVFGMLIMIGQGLAGLSFGIVALALAGVRRPGVFRDLGNLLLTYVLMWAYLAFTQYLIIWAENLPDEISWYVTRVQTGWLWVGSALILAHFFVPLLVLLSRNAKNAPAVLGALAGALLVAHVVDVFWLTVPSVHA